MSDRGPQLDSSPATLHRLVHQQSARDPDAGAILAPGRRPLSYTRLTQQIQEVVATLRNLAVERNDRVGLVLPDGPELAVAVVSIGAGATCAPLNPDYCAAEFEAYLTQLDCRALVVVTGSTSPAVNVARARGARVLELTPRIEDAAGLFS